MNVPIDDGRRGANMGTHGVCGWRLRYAQKPRRWRAYNRAPWASVARDAPSNATVAPKDGRRGWHPNDRTPGNINAAGVARNAPSLADGAPWGIEAFQNLSKRFTGRDAGWRGAGGARRAIFDAPSNAGGVPAAGRLRRWRPNDWTPWGRDSRNLVPPHAES